MCYNYPSFLASFRQQIINMYAYTRFYSCFYNYLSVYHIIFLSVLSSCNDLLYYLTLTTTFASEQSIG